MEMMSSRFYRPVRKSYINGDDVMYVIFTSEKL